MTTGAQQIRDLVAERHDPDARRLRRAHRADRRARRLRHRLHLGLLGLAPRASASPTSASSPSPRWRTRRARSRRVSNAPVIVDADTGYGNAVNVMRTVARLPGRGRGGRVPGGPGLAEEVRPLPGQAGDPDRASTRPRSAPPPTRAASATSSSSPAPTRASRSASTRRSSAASPTRRRAPTRCSSRRRSRSRSSSRSPRELPPPLVANMIERGVTPHLSRAELKDLGFQLIVCPLAALYAAAKAVDRRSHGAEGQGDDRRAATTT